MQTINLVHSRGSNSVNIDDTELARLLPHRFREPGAAVDLARMAESRRGYHAKLCYDPSPLTLVGPGESGKDLVASMLADFVPDLRAGFGTSDVLLPFFWEMYGGPQPGKDHLMPPFMPSFKGDLAWQRSARRDRRQLRKLWLELGNEIAVHEPAFMIAVARAKSDVIVGIRRKRELEEARRLGIITTTVWVDRSKPCDSGDVEICPDDCDLVLQNFGEADQLRRKVYGLAELINFRPKAEQPHIRIRSHG